MLCWPWNTPAAAGSTCTSHFVPFIRDVWTTVVHEMSHRSNVTSRPQSNMIAIPLCRYSLFFFFNLMRGNKGSRGGIEGELHAFPLAITNNDPKCNHCQHEGAKSWTTAIVIDQASYIWAYALWTDYFLQHDHYGVWKQTRWNLLFSPLCIHQAHTISPFPLHI